MGSGSGSAPVPGAMMCAAAAKVTKATTTDPFDPDNASSSMAFSVEVALDSASSISSFPSSSSSSDDGGEHHTSFFTPPPLQQSPSASSLCFGAGGPAGWLLRRSRGARARSPGRKPQEAAAAAAAAKGDVVGWYLRLRKARTKGSPPPGQAADDRERAESVARAVAYCKETLRRGAPPPPPSLDDLLLHDRQEEIIARAAAYSNDPPPWPRRAGWLSEMPAMEKQAKVSPNWNSSIITASHVAHHGHGAMNKCRGEPVMVEEAAMSSSAPSDLETDKLEIRTGSFDEIEFLKFFDGDTEMIARHFITIHI